MKPLRTLLLVLGLSAVLNAPAQSVIAIQDITPDAAVGFLAGGAGFQFSPATNITATSLGYVFIPGAGGSPVPQTVRLWEADALLGSVTVFTNSSLSGQLYYQEIPNVALLPGHTYYIEAGRTTDDLWINSFSGTAEGHFSLAPEIAFYRSAAGTNLDGSRPATLGASDMYLIGANFQYTTVPEPTLMSLALLGAAGAGYVVRQRRERNSGPPSQP